MEAAKVSEPVERTAFDYSWGYFGLHAGQRMQAVNFFLVAAAFIANAYVAAMVGGYFGVAAGVALVGTFVCYAFYKIERRVRRLIHAAEAALRPIERKLAWGSHNPDLAILERVEQTNADAWSYATVFRRLYLAMALAFSIASLFAIAKQFMRTPATTDLFPVVIRLAAGACLLIFGYEVLTTATANSRTEDPPQRVRFYWLVAVGGTAAIVGVAILASVGFQFP